MTEVKSRCFSLKVSFSIGLVEVSGVSNLLSLVSSLIVVVAGLAPSYNLNSYETTDL